MNNFIDHKNFDDILFEYIKDLFDKYNDNILTYFKNNGKLLHMSLEKITTTNNNILYLLRTDNLSDNLIHTDKTINYIIHNLNYFVFDSNFNFKIISKKKTKLDKPYESAIINDIKNNWSEVKIYNHDIGFYTTIFDYDDTLYYVDLYNSPYIVQVDSNKYINTLVSKSELTFKNNISHVIITSPKLSHILYYKTHYVSDDIFLEKCDNIFYSCLDELIFDLENISHVNENKKKLTTGGFILNYKDNDYVINTYIYQKIKDIIPNYKNINKCFIELYKNDNLSFVVNYMSPYPSEIIKRVNAAIKTISREFLNIYHVTRKKLNPELYNILTNNYKTVLFDLHKIFIYKRKTENNNFTNSDDDINEKRSLNHDIIYKYIKKINIDLLVNIFIDRIALLNNIQNITIDMNNIRMNTNEFKILFNDCVHTTTMSYLCKC